MLKSILIGLDGTRCSAKAVELAVRWAHRTEATLVGLAVVDEPAIRGGAMVPLGGDSYKEHSEEVRLQRAHQQATHFLDTFTQTCVNAGVTSKPLEAVGDPHEQILLQAQRYDVILLGRQTAFKFATQEEPCDTLVHVIKHSPRPVVVVPEQLGPENGNVVVAWDGSREAALTLQAFVCTGMAIGRTLHLVSIAEEHAVAETRVQRAADYLGWHQIPNQVHVVATEDNTAAVILKQIQALNASLLVMGAFGHSALREFFLGSVTRTLLDRAPIPLFVMH